jgi:signal transduction histidine kinase
MAIESTRREMALIETMLAATKVDANKIQVNGEKVDMLDVINDAIEGQKLFAIDKKIEIRFEKPKEKFLAYADRIRTQEVMDNLLNNGIKYTQKGYVEIKIEKIKADKQPLIKVTIKDTGIGIAEDDLENLGKKFFRAKQYTNGEEQIVRPGGTGLGLYVVNGLVKAMGGKMNIKSKLGKGSTFSFTLPEHTGQETIINDAQQSRVSVLKFEENYKKLKKQSVIKK